MSRALLAVVTRQLATLVRVMPIEEALRTVAVQLGEGGARHVLLATHASVMEGFRLAAAMARQEGAFPPLYCAIVAAGERSGTLPQILERLADLLEREQETRNQVTAALIYPAALAATALAVVVALMTWVVPKVAEQFDSMGQALPLPTRVVIFLSGAMRDWGWLIAALIAAAAFAFARALKRPHIRRRVDMFLLRLAFAGSIIRTLAATRFARTLSTMIGSGLPLIEGLRLTAETAGNSVLKEAIERMAEEVREGASLSAALKHAQVFPPILVHMTASGEKSGKLAALLSSAADCLDRDMDRTRTIALKLLEPVIIILMGGVVGAIVLSILLPILALNSLTLR